MLYDEDFLTLTPDEFAKTAQPLVDAYRATFGPGKNRVVTADARRALEAHCNAWAITKARKTFVAELLDKAVLP